MCHLEGSGMQENRIVGWLAWKGSLKTILSTFPKVRLLKAPFDLAVNTSSVEATASLDTFQCLITPTVNISRMSQEDLESEGLYAASS